MAARPLSTTRVMQELMAAGEAVLCYAAAGLADARPWLEAKAAAAGALRRLAARTRAQLDARGVLLSPLPVKHPTQVPHPRHART